MWQIWAMRLPVVQVGGHLFLGIFNTASDGTAPPPASDLYQQIHGLATDINGNVIDVGTEKDFIKAYINPTNNANDPNSGSYNRYDPSEQGTLLYSTNDFGKIQLLDNSIQALQQYINNQNFSYIFDPSENLTTTAFNSNSVFVAMATALQQALGVSSALINQALNMGTAGGLFNLGTDTDIFRGDSWAPNVQDATHLGFTLDGTGPNHLLVGGAGSDVLIGESGANLFVGNGGNDTIYGSTRDHLVSSDPNHQNTFLYTSTATTHVTVNVSSSATSKTVTTSIGETDTLYDVENVFLDKQDALSTLSFANTSVGVKLHDTPLTEQERLNSVIHNMFTAPPGHGEIDLQSVIQLANGDEYGNFGNIVGSANGGDEFDLNQVIGRSFTGGGDGTNANTVSYSGVLDVNGMTIDLGQGLAWINAPIAGPPTGSIDTISNFQNAEGTAFNDTIVGDVNGNQPNTFFGSTGDDTYVGGGYNNDGGKNTLDYSTLSAFDPNFTAGHLGVVMAPSGNYDHNDNPIYTVQKGDAGTDGTDMLTNVTQFVGTAANDSFTVDPNEFRQMTFWGSTGNDRYVGNNSNTNILDYSKLSMFDASLNTTSTGIILGTGTDSAGNAFYTIEKGVAGIDGTDTAQNFDYAEINGTIGQDTFNIGPPAYYLTVGGDNGADAFNVSGGYHTTIFGDGLNDFGQNGAEFDNTLDLSGLGGGIVAGPGNYYSSLTSGFLGSDAQGTFYNIDKVVLGGGNNLWSDGELSGTPNAHTLAVMSGTNNTVESDGIKIASDGTIFTDGGSQIVGPTTVNGIQDSGVQNIQLDFPTSWVTIDKLGYTYNGFGGNEDYSQYDKSLTFTLSPTVQNYEYTVSDGQNTDTILPSNGAWLVGTNNGDTYNFTSIGGGGEKNVWLGTADNGVNTINLIHNPNFNQFAPSDPFHFFYTSGNADFNGYLDSDVRIILAPGITSDEVSISTLNSTQMVVDIANHGSITINSFTDPTTGSISAPTIEFWSDQLDPGASNGSPQLQYIANLHLGDVQAGDLSTTFDTDLGFSFSPAAPGQETLTATAGNHYTVEGGPGDKVIEGSANNNDTLNGGTGNDTILAGNGNEFIDAQFGNDTIVAGSGNDEIHCGWGNCTVNLGSGAATVYTEEGNQTINCGSGAVTIIGGTGNDTLVTGSGSETAYGNLASMTYALTSHDPLTVMDYHPDRDTLEYIDSNLAPQSIATSRVGEDLVLTNSVSQPGTDTVTIHDFFASDSGQNQTLDLSFASLGPLSSSTSSATFTVDSSGNTISIVLNNGSTNQAPVAENGSFTMDENHTLTGNVLANNGNGATTDPDGDTVTAQAGTYATANGATVVIASNGSFTYTPQDEQHGTDSFTYMALDPQGASSTATITINITPDTPDAKNGSFTLNENSVLMGNVLADNGNGATTDPDGDLVGAQTGTFATAHGGTVEISGNGDFTYTPAAGFHGTDSFTFSALDAQGESGSATISIAVNPDIPVAQNGNFTMAENGSLTGNVLADNGFGPASDPDNDLAGVTAGTFATANGGTLVLAANGDFTYTPAHGFFGADTFAYTLFDQEGQSATANINIGVAQGIPVVENAGFSVAENASVMGNVLADNGHGAAFDPDGDALTAQAGTFATANGSVTIAANGDFTYTPNAGFFGTDTFSFTANDGSGGAATGTMTVNIAKDLPIAEDGVFSMVHDTVLSGNLLADNGFGVASDPDGDLAGTQAATITTANGGQVIIHSDGTFTYTPASGFTGNDTFNYTLLDADGASANATIQVKVTGSTPVAYNETITTTYGQPVTGNLLANNGSGAAFDPDGDPLHLVGTAALTSEGFQVQLSSNGGFTAAIPAWFVGQDSLNYTVSDPNGDEATATATLNIATPTGAIVGTSGNDSINDTSTTNHSIFTLQGNDVVHCGGGTDTVYLGPGNDTVYAGTGVDTMIGGGGNDTFTVNSTQDVVIESNQHVADTIISSVSFTLPQNIHNLVLTGTGNLTATCNNQGDTVVTNSGVDTVNGGTGDDTIYVNNSSDLVVEHSGYNSVIASVDYKMPSNGVESLTFTGTASLTGQGNNLDNTMTANNGGDVLKDGNGDDTLIGGLGDDVITGGSGTNLIYGGGGNDLLTGGNGSDTFVFKDATAFTGESTIKDFTINGAHSDVLDIKNIIDTVDPSGNNLHNFVQLTQTGSNAFLAINPDGSGWTDIVKFSHGSSLNLDTLIANGNLVV